MKIHDIHKKTIMEPVNLSLQGISVTASDLTTGRLVGLKPDDLWVNKGLQSGMMTSGNKQHTEATLGKILLGLLQCVCVCVMCAYICIYIHTVFYRA